MARPRTSTQDSRPPASGGSVQTALDEAAPGPDAAPASPPEANGEQTAAPSRRPPSLPTAKTTADVPLDRRTVLLHGPPGIGKSTLASQWAGGEVFFFDTAGELTGIPCYRQPIGSWVDFREYAWALAENPTQFQAAAIDTFAMLCSFAEQTVAARLGVRTVGDAEFGAGWRELRLELETNLAKLANLEMGLVLVAHSQEVEIKTRSATYTKTIPQLQKTSREVVEKAADLVLYIDWADGEDEARVIRTKPSKLWDAKERGLHVRLPEEIPWPLGRSGYDVLREAWEKGAES